MTSEAPPFWWQAPDWRAYALYPISAIYGTVARRRMTAARREPIDVPVLCVGNFTVGGAGKTPVAIALARQARRMKLSPGFLSRGFGGKFPVPHVVDVHRDSARHVGDEPLLLAAHAPVAVTPDRAAGAKLLASRGCDFLIMDDGFQSARIHMDYALLVVDGRRGVGNGHVIPGGPVRAPLVHQMRFVQGLLKVGEGEAANDIIRMAARAGRPVYEAHTEIRDPAAVCRPALSCFRRHRRPGQILRHRDAGRRHGRDDAQLRRPSLLHERRSRRSHHRRCGKRARTHHHGEGRGASAAWCFS